MSRDLISFTIGDASQFAKTLRAALSEREDLPGHAEFLGLVAKAAGYANYQHLRAEQDTPLNDRLVEKTARVFDAEARMKHWPGQTSVQGLCLWVLWARIPRATELTEPEVNTHLRAAHHFGDHVLLRRSLIDAGLMTRTPNGSAYRRTETPPPPEARALLRRLAGRT